MARPVDLTRYQLALGIAAFLAVIALVVAVSVDGSYGRIAFAVVGIAAFLTVAGVRLRRLRDRWVRDRR
ncbi:hypothetical protein ASG36_13025 [Geodermatophilus sp. Leaf369]|uniref:hypothetical protein n=1 Tax=Geodermatophilus sp. Leaf369 TaxID=1736354 RepID=UPI0006F33E25|nr:hypothetical protein [Geodermatophilus sp. Leaf369]KQS58893.1 hypothetical protein ASG36_13025 [Geodermatophilus sp. Leaf369]